MCSLDDMLARTEGSSENAGHGDTSRDIGKEDETESTSVPRGSSKRFVRQTKGAPAGNKGSAAKRKTVQRRSRRKKGGK